MTRQRGLITDSCGAHGSAFAGDPFPAEILRRGRVGDFSLDPDLFVSHEAALGDILQALPLDPFPRSRAGCAKDGDLQVVACNIDRRRSFGQWFALGAPGLGLDGIAAGFFGQETEFGGVCGFRTLSARCAIQVPGDEGAFGKGRICFGFHRDLLPDLGGVWGDGEEKLRPGHFDGDGIRFADGITLAVYGDDPDVDSSGLGENGGGGSLFRFVRGEGHLGMGLELEENGPFGFVTFQGSLEGHGAARGNRAGGGGEALEHHARILFLFR